MAASQIKIAVYPGSFDPITNGHLDVITRALNLFDKLIVTVAENRDKQPLFTVDERLEMIRVATEGLGNLEVDHFSGLLVDYCAANGAGALIRGLRALTDFEQEFQMALMNRHMNPDVVTVFLMPHARYTHLNSSIIREIAELGGDVSDFVPDIVVRYLKRKYSHD